MRFDEKKSFGYPVLRKFSNDYVGADISSSIELIIPETRDDLCRLEYSVLIGVSEIKDALRIKDLGLVVSIFCPKTLYSKSVFVFELMGQIEIDANNLRGDVFINTELVVAKDSYLLSSTKIHPEFGINSFQLSEGDLIAQAMPQKLFIEREVFQPVTSLFQWVPTEEIQIGEWRLDWDEQAIKILLHPIQQQKLNMACEGPEGRAILLNSIFMPALIKLIDAIVRQEADQEDLWVKVICAKSANLGIDVSESTNSLELAQKLLKLPLSVLNKTLFKED